MTGITPDQYIKLLKNWNEHINEKQKKLTLGYRVYMTLFVLYHVTTGCLSVAISILSSYNLGTIETQNVTRVIITNSLICGFSLIIAFITGANIALKFGETAKLCSVTAKQYAELYREIQVNIEECYNLDENIPKDNFFNKALYYSTKEQLILQGEPGMIFIGYSRKPVFDNLYRKDLLLNAEEIHYINNFVMEMPESDQKSRLEDLLKKILEVEKKEVEYVEIPIEEI